MADQILSGGEMCAASATDPERKGRSDGRSCQRRYLLLGTQQSSTLDNSQERRLP